MIYPFFKFRFTYLISCLLILCFLACSKEKNIENLVAVVEDEEITIEDFRVFYESDPNFGIDSTGLNALQDELNKYIDQYLARLKAEEEDLWDDVPFVRAYQWEKRQAMLRQFNREIGEKSVEVTDEEMLQEFINLNVEVQVRYLYATSEARIEEINRQLQAGRSFESLAAMVFQDTILSRNGGDLGWLRLTDFEENLIERIRQLKIGQISKPISSIWGFYIVELLNRKENSQIGDEDYLRLKPKLKKLITKKKSRILSNKYISNYLGELNLKLNKLSFRQLLHVLVPPEGREKKEYTNRITVSDAMIIAAEEDLSDLADQDLITYNKGSVSIREYLHALMEIPSKHRPRFNNAQQFADQISEWERDNLVLEKAVELNLDENHQVQKEISAFKRKQSYNHYFNKLIENMPIPNFVYNYFQLPEESRWQATQHPLYGFYNLETWRKWRTELNLRLELRSEKPSIKINYKLLEQENKDIDWENQSRMFKVRKPA
jgi:hypothetical protein